MTVSSLRIVIADGPDKEKLFAELYHDGEQWGVISQETASPRLEIYPSDSGAPWVFDLDELIRLLQQARTNLLGK